MATIYEVSKLAGVSLATVSRVINNNAKVSPKTAEKVQQAMKTLGYRPNAIAQSLASNRTNSIGILIPELHGPFFGQMMAGIEAKLRAAGKHVIITTGHSEEEKEKDGLNFLIDRQCDAVIAHVEAVSDDYLISLSQGNTPIYLVGRYIEQLKSHCVCLDNELGGYLATKTLIKKGHRNIAYIAGIAFKPDSIARLNGHKRALAEHNIPYDPTYVYEGDYKETGGINGLKHFIKQGLSFTALACANDEMASGAMKYAREHGYQLPEQLSIIGFDNVIFANYLYPTLTTINNRVDEMGEAAANMVLRDIYKRRISEPKHMFTPTVIERHSVATIS
jgi:LacI family transcriptional regulator